MLVQFTIVQQLCVYLWRTTLSWKNNQFIYFLGLTFDLKQVTNSENHIENTLKTTLNKQLYTLVFL